MQINKKLWKEGKEKIIETNDKINRGKLGNFCAFKIMNDKKKE